MFDLWEEILDIVYPRWCAGCGAWDEDLCENCRQLFGPWQRAEARLPYLSHVSFDDSPDTAPFAVFALADYTGPVSHAIVRWKNVSDARMDRAFTELLLARDPPDLPARRQPLLAIPAPSKRKREREGRFVARVCTQALASQLDAQLVHVLRKSAARGGDLKTRGAKTRSIGLANPSLNLSGYDVVLVDDVVTTGATLAGASRAVKSAGGRVIGAFALAAANDPRNLQWVKSQAGSFGL